MGSIDPVELVIIFLVILLVIGAPILLLLFLLSKLKQLAVSKSAERQLREEVAQLKAELQALKKEYSTS